MVAKSYQDLPIISDVFYHNNKPYVKVRLQDGSSKTVRDYSDSEYKRMYNEEPPQSSMKITRPQKEVLGFIDGYITIFKGKTYENKEFLHDIGCTYQRMWGWSLASDKELPDLPDDIEPIRLNWSDVGTENGTLKPEDQVIEFVESLQYAPTDSTHQGTIGERLDLNIVVIANTPFEGRYGRAVAHTFEDISGNHYTWFTSSKDLPVGNQYHIRGTVKEHTVYHDDAQTVLTRCMIVDK